MMSFMSASSVYDTVDSEALTSHIVQYVYGRPFRTIRSATIRDHSRAGDIAG